MIKHIDLIRAERDCKAAEAKREEYNILIKSTMVSIHQSLSFGENRCLIQLWCNPVYEKYFNILKKDFELQDYKINIIELEYTEPNFLWIKGKTHKNRYLEISWK